LELDGQERKAGSFVCPECQRRTDFAPEAKLRQNQLPKHPVCPECSYETTLSDLDRDRLSYICSGCQSEISYVEE
jgi:DNA-directed RNA polymerase subunit RPC12/RpoP